MFNEIGFSFLNISVNSSCTGLGYSFVLLMTFVSIVSEILFKRTTASTKREEGAEIIGFSVNSFHTPFCVKYALFLT